MFKDKKFLYAIATLIGTIVGVGMFGIPYVIAKSGFLIGLGYLIILGSIVLIIHLLYGEVTLRTLGKHRFPGYVQEYLGRKGKNIVAFTSIFGLTGALLAYIIIGGEFLWGLLSPAFGGNVIFYSLAFFIFGALCTYFGIRSIGKSELIMVCFLIFVILILFVGTFSSVKIDNLATLDLKFMFLPYGVILFSLLGASIIPEVREVLQGSERKLKKVIFWGAFIPVIIYILFTFLVVGVTGGNTSSEALIGLKNILGDKLVSLGLVFGFLAVATSFLTLGLTLKKIYWYDFKINKNISWALASFIPLILFLAGVNNFIAIIGLTGAVLGGIDGIILILIHRKARALGKRKPEYSIKLPFWIGYLLILMFTLGIAYQIFYFIKK